MIGCATGALGAGLVVDIDPGTHPDTGEILDVRSIQESLEAFLDQKLPVTLTARSPRGGLHLYFALSRGQSCGNRAGLVRGVDVRCEGGYVILPPSRRWDGKQYEWTNDSPIAVAPAALVNAVMRRGQWARGGNKRAGERGSKENVGQTSPSN